MTAEPARPPVATLDDHQVVIAGAVAARLAPALRRLARQATRDGLRLDEDLAQVLDACEAAERAHPRRPQAAAGTTLAPAGSGPPRSCRSLGVSEVARRVGTSERAVRKAAGRRRLAGRLGPDGRWWFQEGDVQAWQASRRGRRSA